MKADRAFNIIVIYFGVTQHYVQWSHKKGKRDAYKVFSFS